MNNSQIKFSKVLVMFSATRRADDYKWQIYYVVRIFITTI